MEDYDQLAALMGQDIIMEANKVISEQPDTMKQSIKIFNTPP